MKKNFVLAALVITALSGPALAQEAITVNTDIGVILDNYEAKKVLDKHVPGLTAAPEIDQARGMALSALRQYLPGLTEAKLKEIDADFAKIKQ